MNEAKERKRCSRCTLPSNFRNIKFDKNGVCNFCHNHDKYIEKFRRFSLAERNFLEQVEANRGKFQYDCAVGLSGGKDTTYVLYKLVRDYNLKVLAITFNNNFQNEIAKNDIKFVVDDLNVDHVVISYEKDLHYRLYKEAAIQFGWPCIACSFLGFGLMQRYCFDHKIPFFVHGMARSQMLRELSRHSHHTYLPMYTINYRPFNFSEYLKLVKFMRKSMDRIIKMFIKGKVEREEFTKKHFIDPATCEQQQFVPQFIAYFLMHDYNEPEIIAFMKKDVLKDQSKELKEYHHYDCLGYPAFMYIYKQVFGWSLLEFEIASDVRDGKISRDRALELIKNEKEVQTIPEESFGLFCSKINMSRDDLLDSLSIARKNIRMHKQLMRIKNSFKVRPIKYL
jgi:hypothetical protein